MIHNPSVDGYKEIKYEELISQKKAFQLIVAYESTTMNIVAKSNDNKIDNL